MREKNKSQSCSVGAILQTNRIRMTNVKAENSTLILGRKTVSFSNPIAELLEFNDSVVIRLELTGEDFPEKHENVIAVNFDGSIRWKIEKAPEEGYYDSYAAIYEKDGELWAYNLSGMSYKIDLTDGSIIDEKWVK